MNYADEILDSSNGKISLRPSWAKSIEEWVTQGLGVPDGFTNSYCAIPECLVDAAIAKAKIDPEACTDNHFMTFLKEYKSNPSYYRDRNSATYSSYGLPQGETPSSLKHISRLRRYFRVLYEPQNLWLDQKVAFLVNAIEHKLFPVSLYDKEEDRYKRKGFISHSFDFSCTEWLSNGKSRFAETLGVAYLREMEAIDVSRFDLEELRPYLGDEVEQVAEYAQAVLRGQHLAKAYDIETVIASLSKTAQDKMDARDDYKRKPYHGKFWTYYDVIHLTIYEERLRRKQERINNVVKILFGW